MQSGLINKVAIIPSVTDGKGLSHLCLSTGAIYADKAYFVKSARHASEGQGCHLAAIKKNNMIGKNKDLDSWLTKIRAPYEQVFSKKNKRKINFQHLWKRYV